MSYLADTDCVIDYLKGQTAALALLRSFAPSGLAISLITYGEIYDGIYSSADVSNEERGILALLEWVALLSLDEAIMRRFARIRGDLRRRGQKIGDMDILIAATALEHDLILVTRNIVHFARIPTLRLHSVP